MKKSRLFILTAVLLSLASLAQSQTSPEISVQTGHVGMFSVDRSVAFSHTGSLLASSGGANDIIVWDVDQRRQLRTFTGHTNGITALAFLPDDRTFVSAGKDGAIHQWDIASGKRVRTFEQTSDAVKGINISEDGARLLSYSFDKLSVWDVATGRRIWTIGYQPVGDKYKFFSAVFSPDRNYIIVTCFSGTVAGLSSSDGSIKMRAELPGVFAPVVVGFSDDRTALIQAYSEVASYDIVQNAIRKTKLPHPPDKMSSDDKYILCKEINYPKEITVVDAVLLKQVATVPIDYDLSDISLSANGTYLAVADWKNGIKVYDGKTGKKITSLESDVKEPYSVSMSKDDRFLSYIYNPYADSVSIHAGRMTAIFSLSNSAFVREFSVMERHNEIMKLFALQTEAGLKQGKTLMRELEYYAAAKETQLSYDTTKRMFYFVNPIMFTKSVAIYEAPPENTEEALQSPLYAIPPTPSDISKWRMITSFAYHTAPIGPATFSLEKKLILTGGEDKTIRLVQFPTGRLLKTFYGHTGSIKNLTFSSDGNRFVSSSADGTVRLWDLRSGKEVAKFISFRDGEWIVISTEGYFNASSGGAKHLNVRVGNAVYSMDNFFETYFRPDIVNALIAGASLADLSLDRKITDGIKSPPTVSLLVMRMNGQFAPATGKDERDVKISNGTIEVSVTAASTGGGIYGVRLFNNGKAVGEDVRGFKQVTTGEAYERRFTVAVINGENTLRAVGISDDMSESNPVTATVRYASVSTAKPAMYILAIGINEYRNKKYNLNYCVDDLKGFIETITPQAKKIFSKVNTTLLMNREANQRNLLNAFETLKASINAEDVFILFYAGHGIAMQRDEGAKGEKKEFYYILTDVTQMTDPVKAEQDGLSGTEMKKRLSGIKAAKQVLFIDACNSGAFTEQFTLRGAAEENALAKLSRSTGSVIFASTTKEQFASEFKELHHGVFTYVLIDALKGNASLPDGQLTVASLKAFMDEQIPAVTKRYKGEEQFPTSFIWGQDFPIGMK